MLGCLQSDLVYEILGYWLLVSGAAGFVIMGVDKARAIGGEWRIAEVTLIAIALLGGAVGETIGMLVFHHKNSKPRFLVIFIPILALWLFALGQTGFLGCLATAFPR